jgi:FKBP-type peptidyl-prolyl cis-trans isomerase
VRLRTWLPKGEQVKHSEPPPNSGLTVEDDGYTCIGPLHLHRGRIIASLFYGVEGMRVGGTRRLKISPHLAYGETGTPNIPGNAALVMEITILEECS